MAIKFVDKEPEDGRATKKADVPAVKREPEGGASEPSLDPELPHAKPARKARDRKKPLK